MSAPSIDELTSTFRDLQISDAKLIRSLWNNVDDRDELEKLVERVPKTASYVRSLFRCPYNCRMWRRTVALHAIDVLVDGFGIEALGEREDPPYAPPYEYSNTGDMYAGTIIFDRERDVLFIGSWADVAEQLEKDEDDEEDDDDGW